MFARLERELRNSGDPADKARADIVGSILQDRGQDIPFPTGTPEVEVKIIRFSPEARGALLKEGYSIYALTGASIAQLREQGNQFWSDWHEGIDFENKTSPSVEVAVNPKQLFLKYSTRKTMEEQDEMVAKFSTDLRTKIGGVKAIIGEANQYAEVAFDHLKATGKKLFGKDNNFDYTRTKTRTVEPSFAIVGQFGESGLTVGVYLPGFRDGLLWVSPLVVPDQAV